MGPNKPTVPKVASKAAAATIASPPVQTKAPGSNGAVKQSPNICDDDQKDPGKDKGKKLDSNSEAGNDKSSKRYLEDAGGSNSKTYVGKRPGATASKKGKFAGGESILKMSSLKRKLKEEHEEEASVKLGVLDQETTMPSKELSNGCKDDVAQGGVKAHGNQEEKAGEEAAADFGLWIPTERDIKRLGNPELPFRLMLWTNRKWRVHLSSVRAGTEPRCYEADERMGDVHYRVLTELLLKDWLREDQGFKKKVRLVFTIVAPSSSHTEGKRHDCECVD